MNEPTQFSGVCPKCQGARVETVGQVNNSGEHGEHVTTTRRFACRDCRATWKETIPSPGPT